jgi:peptide/nickel transport system permease protein
MFRWRLFFRQKQNLLGVLIVLLFFVVAWLAPVLAPPEDPTNPLPFKPLSQSFQRIPEPPSPGVPLGTAPQIRNLALFGIAPGQDAAFQWDIYYTLIWGTRSALRFGLLVTFCTALFGILVGAISGYLGGMVERVIMRITDAFLAFPVIAAIWVLQRAFFSWTYNVFLGEAPPMVWWEVMLERLGFDPIMLALIAFSWMPYARLINSQVGQLRKAVFVQAAESLGASHGRVLFHHLLPNAISPAVILAARDVGASVILASAFIFIGFTGNVAWGVLLVSSRDYVIGIGGNPFAYWWTFVPISLALILFSIGWNLLGDGLNALLNPHRN